MAIFGQYSGQRVSALPPGFLGASMTSAANLQKGIASVGESIGDALKQYGKNKAEKQEWEAMIPQLAAEAIETRKFLEGDKPPSSLQDEYPGAVGPKIDQTLTESYRQQGQIGPDESVATDAHSGGVVPWSEKTLLLYEIAGGGKEGKKLVDAYISNDASLAQLKGLAANLSMYNNRIKNFANKAAIEDYRFKSRQRDAHHAGAMAGMNLGQIEVSPASIEQFSETETVNPKSQLDDIHHRRLKGEMISDEEQKIIDDYEKSGGTFEDTLIPDLSNFDPRLDAPGIRLYDRNTGQYVDANTSPEAKLKMDVFTHDVKPKFDEDMALWMEQGKRIDDSFKKYNKRKTEQDIKVVAFNNRPDALREVKHIDQVNRLLQNPNINPKAKSAILERGRDAQKRLDDLKRKAGVMNLTDYNKIMHGISKAQADHDLKKPTIEGVVQEINEGQLEAMPEGGYAAGDFTRTVTSEREVPAQFRDATQADRKAAHMEAFISKGGIITPEEQARFDSMYPEAKDYRLGELIPATMTINGEKVALGGFLYDPRTGQFKESKGKGEISWNELQSKIAIYRTQMAQAEKDLATAGELGAKPEGWWAMAQRNAPTVMQSDAWRMYESAAAKWIQGKLRFDSGAAVPIEEAKNYISTWFPVPGDSKEVVRTKERQRKSAVLTMDKILGPDRIKALGSGEQPGQPGGAGGMRRFDSRGKEIK